MTAKQLLPSQCDTLHQAYGVDDCCLCKANARIQELERQVAALQKMTIPPSCGATTLDDGFGNRWSSICPNCGKDSMSIVRPGKVQCSECG